MDQFFSRLTPFDCPELTKKRLGKTGDGGYVIPMEILKEIEAVVVFGINDEDSFELELAQYLDPKKIPFYLCDPFVHYHAAGKNDFNFLPIGLGGETKDKMMSLPDFLKKYSLEGKKILLKVDIEGAEWESFANLELTDLQNVPCLIVEYHGLIHLQELYRQIKTFELMNTLFFLNHVHVNNNGLVFKHEDLLYPDVIECTYVSKAYAYTQNLTLQRRTEIYPSEIDQTNNPDVPDHSIGWWIT